MTERPPGYALVLSPEDVVQDRKDAMHLVYLLSEVRGGLRNRVQTSRTYAELGEVSRGTVVSADKGRRMAADGCDGDES